MSDKTLLAAAVEKMKTQYPEVWQHLIIDWVGRVDSTPFGGEDAPRRVEFFQSYTPKVLAWNRETGSGEKPRSLVLGGSSGTMWWISDGSYMGARINDPRPPGPGDSVADGVSYQSMGTRIPLEVGEEWEVRRFRLPPSPNYREVVSQRPTGKSDGLGTGIVSTVYHTRYKTVAPGV